MTHGVYNMYNNSSLALPNYNTTTVRQERVYGGFSGDWQGAKEQTRDALARLKARTANLRKDLLATFYAVLIVLGPCGLFYAADAAASKPAHTYTYEQLYGKLP